MARCPLCESDVPDGRTTCDACGQLVGLPVTPRATPEMARKAIDAARKELASGRGSGDATFPRSLLERAEQTEAAGDFGRALDLARAVRRSLEISRRGSRLTAALSRADAVLAEAKKAGIETVAFERNLEQARALAARGDAAAAERLLRRVSVRTLDQRRERVLQAILDKADAHVRYAKERGGTIREAEAALKEARGALAVREYNRIRPLAAKAIEKADHQRRQARAETILDRAASEIDAARREGVNISEARRILTQAREALRHGVFADIPVLAQKARNGLREARGSAAAEAVLREAQREAAREKRRGAQIESAERLLAQADASLATKDYHRVRELAKEAHDAVQEAARLKTVREAFTSLQLDAEELQRLGAQADDFRATLVELTHAVERKDLAAARRLVAQARHASEAARDAHFREVMERSLKVILSNAARGLDPEVGRQLLREVDDAISLGKQVDMQALIDNRMAQADAETEARMNERVIQARDDIVALRQAGQADTVGLEGKLADAAIALQDRRFLQADAFLDGVEHDIFATRELLRSQAAEILGQARGEVARARADGIPVEAAQRMLVDAETSYSESRYGDTIYAGRACVTEVEELARLAADTKKKSAAEEMRARLEKTEVVHRRLEAVRAEIANLIAYNVDLGQAVDTLAAAETAILGGSLEEAERLIAAAEGVVQGVKVTMIAQAQDALQRARKAVAVAQADGIVPREVEELLRRADEAIKDGRPTEVLSAVADVEHQLAEGRRTKYQEEQRRTLEKARKAATKFIMVKRLIDDLRKADIDISGAEEGLRAAERALEERQFDDVDAILTDLDSTAKELMEELVGAAKDLLARAERKMGEGQEADIAVDEASSLLKTARAHFDRGEFAEAIEHAKASEQKVLEALRSRADEDADRRRKAEEVARAEVASIRKVIGDLGRADITILGADQAVAAAEAALQAGQFQDIGAALAETRDMAATLTFGLGEAAKDLVARAKKQITEFQKEGLDPGRAALVLQNAQEAVQDGRFIEAIEYRKVIQDILDDVRRAKLSKTAREGLPELRARVEAHAKLGADVRMASELLARAESSANAGAFKEVEDYARRVGAEVDIARKALIGSAVDTFAAMVQDGIDLGLEEDALQEYRSHAEDAAAADDLEEVYRLKGDLQEELLEAKRHSIVKRSMDEIEALEEIITQSERLEIPAGTAREHLETARKAIVDGDVSAFQGGLAQARAALEESRKKHFLERYEARVHAVGTMIANAKRLGAELGDVDTTLEQAETALRADDMAMADILIKQAEVSIGMQIQNFIKNRYPNLALRLPASGLQAGEWNQYTFEVENRGKLPARNVQVEFAGDLETKGAPAISEIGVGDSVPVRVGLKPKSAGSIPVAIGVSYQRLFDENRYEVRDTKEIRIEPEATYLVEDVFLIHGDGRLIAHHSRKFREEIDEDIFSGMLTVVQDFVKDSFKSRSRIGMKRLDFGDSKILIERSPHAFLAAVLVGREPRLLPLYMLQVLKEVEDQFGSVLERWTGLLHQLDGVDGIVKKLLLVPKDPSVDMGALADSPVTMAAKVIDTLDAADASEANELLARAQSTLDTDIQLAWQFIEQAKDQAENVQGRLKDRMGEILADARATVDELKSIGADTSQAELLLREAEEAFAEAKYDRVREIQRGLHESLERHKGERAAKKVEVELASLINDIQIAKSQGLDVREAESYLTKIEGAIQKKNAQQMEDFLRRAKESLVRQRRRTVLDKARADLWRVEAAVSRAKAFDADVGDVEEVLARAEDALRAEDLKGIEPLIERADGMMKSRIEKILRDRTPRLFLETKNSGMQANRWNRFEMHITNKGNWPAEQVTPTVSGPIDVLGLKSFEALQPNQTAILDFGLRPREAGTMDLDFEVRYTRPLDDGKHQTTESVVVRVEPEGGYAIEDALLFHSTGALVCHVGRGYLLPEEASRGTKLEEKTKGFVNKAFPNGGKGIQRASFEGSGIVAAKGPQAYLAVCVRGEEPAILPLYMVQLLKEVHDQYGVRLDAWTGDPAELAGIEDVVRKILYATDAEGVSLGPLEDSPVSRIPVLVSRGLLTVEGDVDFIAWARSTIEEHGYEHGLDLLRQASESGGAPTEEISRQIKQAIIASKEAGTLQITDDQVGGYVDFLRRTLEASFQAKRRSGIEQYWPVARIAVKTSDQLGYDAVSAFRKIIVGQSGAKELDLIAPNETWRGMKIDVEVHMDSVSAAYKLWAKKIEILLRSQDAWKIKAGLDRGEYSVGIEGQKVRIDPTMVSFIESVPDYVAEEPFDGGVVYLDTRMSKELVAEGYSKEIVNLVREGRIDMKISEDRVVEIELVAGKELRQMLQPWKDMILRDANALEVRFVQSPADDAYVIEAGLGNETFLLGLRAAEM